VCPLVYVIGDEKIQTSRVFFSDENTLFEVSLSRFGVFETHVKERESFEDASLVFKLCLRVLTFLTRTERSYVLNTNSDELCLGDQAGST
jgi:hypothetical protein